MSFKSLSTCACLAVAAAAPCMADVGAIYGMNGMARDYLSAHIYKPSAAPGELKVVNVGNDPVELDSMMEDFDHRAPPLAIYSYSFTMPEVADGEQVEQSVFTRGSAEDMIISLIQKHEAGPKGYASVWAGNRTPLPKKPTQMTVCEVRDWQLDAGKRQKSTAIGMYQIVGDTFRSLLKRMDLACDTLFNQETQDQMGLSLLNSRGWQEFRAGKLSVEAFGYELAGEWAAFPSTKGRNKGKSRYAGIAGNAHGIELPKFLAYLNEVKIAADGKIEDPRPKVRLAEADVEPVVELAYAEATLEAAPPDNGRRIRTFTRGD